MWINVFLAGLSLAGAWLLPTTIIGAVLATMAAIFFCRLGTKTFYCYAAGCLAYSIAFAWLTFTIHYFGGFTTLPTFIIYLLFVFGSAFQFVIFSWCLKHAPRNIRNYTLSYPLAWLASEACWIRIFPWSFGHSLLPITPLALGASLGGVALLTFVMVWLGGCIVSKHYVGILSCTVAILALVSFGMFYKQELDVLTSKVPQLSLSLVQANVSIEERSAQRFFANNRIEYVKLSQHLSDSDLIVWPEGVIQEWIHTGTKTVYKDSRLPRFSNNLSPNDPAWVVGTMMYDDDRNFFNSALVIEPLGTLPPPYHKQILMPFGEYIPFARYIGWIGGISERIGELTPGKAVQVFNVQLNTKFDNKPHHVRFAPLICYEDIIAKLSSDATQRGASLLINLTNDAWFGRGVAATQHHQIAAFRAIENGRILARATNSGLTAIIDATGQTVASLPQFTANSLTESIPLLEHSTVVNKLSLINWAYYLGCIYFFGILLMRLYRK
jgi:apolipoprotein N-acyltransferase